MSTFVIVTVEAGGNVPPTLAIGRELVARGHTLHALGSTTQRTVFEAAGIAFSSLNSLDFWDSSVRRSVPAALASAVRLASNGEITREVAEGLAAIAPDAVVVDCLMASSLDAARRAEIPTAVLFHTFLAFWRGGYARGPVGLLARLRGRNIHRTWATADAQLVVTDRELDPAGEADHGSRAVWLGPAETGLAAAPKADLPPLVLVSLSTTWFPGQTEAYQNIVTALGSLPVRALVTTGGLEPDRTLEPPSNVEIVGRAPHAEIMPEASVVVGHGGHSTTFAALAHDLPLVVMPMHPMLDQPMVGRAVARAGAAIVLPRTATPAAIAKAVGSLLASSAARDAAAHIGARIRATDAAGAGADRLELLAAANRVPGP